MGPQHPEGRASVIGEIRDAVPDRYGKWSEERLRKAYYEALSAQSGKSPISGPVLFCAETICNVLPSSPQRR